MLCSNVNLAVSREKDGKLRLVCAGRGGVKLRSSGGDGVDALQRFCNNGDDSALEEVEWAFYEEPRSMGLQGLLIARGRREARVAPIDRLATETENILGANLSAEDRSELRRVLELHRRTDVGRTSLVTGLVELAGGQSLQSQELSAEWRQLLSALAAASPDVPEKARTLAERWAAIDALEPTDIVVAPNLLLGLARLLSRDDVDLGNIGEDDQLALTLLEGDGIEFNDRIDQSLPQRLFHFLWDKVRDAGAFGLFVFDPGIPTYG